MPHPLDQLYCTLRDLTEQLRKVVELQTGQQASGGRGPLRAEPGDTTQRQFSARTSGRLVGSNDRRRGMILHNATDGTLLLSLDSDGATLENYFFALGPYQTLDTRGVDTIKNLRQALGYAWVTKDTDLSDYPADVFARASGGALQVTELVMQTS